MPKELKTKDIKDREIFAAGTWNGDIYTTDDLDYMVEAFNKTKDKIKPYLKLGHNAKQSMLQADGLPAAGWLTNMRRSGEKLIADFVNIPETIYKLLEVGAYRTLSPEIYWGLNLEGDKYKYLLKAVAILGADVPACTTIGDIMSLYAKGGPAIAYAEGAEVRTYEIKTEDTKMEKEMKELQEKLANAEKLFAEEQTKCAAYAVEIEGMTKRLKETADIANELQTKCDGLEKKYSEVTEAARVVEINAKIDELITAKKVLPAQREMLFAIIKNMPREAKYSIDGKEETLEGLVMKFAETYTPVNLPTEPAANGKAPEVKKFNNDDDAKHAAIEKYMAEHKTSYTKAYEAITLEARTEAAKGKAE